MKIKILLMSAEGDYLDHTFKVASLEGTENEWSPGHIADELPNHFKGICKAEAETADQGVKLILHLDPAPDSIRCRIFLLCFASFVTTLCDRIWA